ncbi:MAG: hypothetical protein AAF541_06815 [Pseudomonadota bacterium]
MTVKKRKNKHHVSPRDQLVAIGSVTLDDSDREALYGDIQGFTDSWKTALERGATEVDLRALTSLHQLVTGEYEVVEEKYAIKNELGEVVGTRKVTKPGPNFQAVKLWLDRRPTALSQSNAISVAKESDEQLESKEQLISSILSLIPPTDAPSQSED